MKCVVCGKEVEDGYLCGICTVEKFEVAVIEPFEIVICSRCGAVKYGQKWKYVEFDEAIEEMVFRYARVMEDFEVERVSIDIASRTAVFAGRLKGDEVEFPVALNFRVKKFACPKCSRESGGYYESIVQLRADSRQLEEDEIERVKEIVEDVLSAELENERAFLSKVEEKREGIDFYFGSRDIGRKVSRMIAKELGGKITESKKLHTRIDGRDVYRFTYLVRLPCYREGDIVAKDESLCVVKNVKAGKGVDILSGKSVNIDGAKVVVRKYDLKTGVVVSVDENVAEIVCNDGRVFVTVKPHAARIGSEVFVFEYRGRVWALSKDL